MSESIDVLAERLRGLVKQDVTDVASAEITAEAARLVRELLLLEEQARDLLARASAPAGAAEEAIPYEASGFEGLTLHEAARRALVAAGAPMHVRDLGARVKAGGWRHPRSPRARPDQIEYQLAARLPRHPDLFRKVAPNTFGLASWGEFRRLEGPRIEPVRGRGKKLARAIAEQPDLVFSDEPKWRSS